MTHPEFFDGYGDIGGGAGYEALEVTVNLLATPAPPAKGAPSVSVPSPSFPIWFGNVAPFSFKLP